MVEVTNARATEPIEADKSLGELFSQLSHDVGELLTAQVELAKVELKDEAGSAARSAGMLGGAAVAALLALLLLSMAAAWGLSEVVPEGVGFALVGAVWVVAALVLYVSGRNRLREVDPVPGTRETIKEDVQWAKQQMS